jgi:hypothetical protein
METCSTPEAEAQISPEVLARALSAATSWSERTYGADCLVCAQIYAIQPDRFSVHITSPIPEEETPINTSATLTFSRSDARLLQEAKSHSCHARLVKK